MSEVLQQTHTTCRTAIDEKFRAVEDRIGRDEEVTEKRLDGHALDIKTVNSMMARLIALQESADKRFAAMEESNAARLATLESRKSFWESPVGIWVIKACVIAGILVLCVAIGVNYLDALQFVK